MQVFLRNHFPTIFNHAAQIAAQLIPCRQLLNIIRRNCFGDGFRFVSFHRIIRIATPWLPRFKTWV
jgi:hypothetical protein